MPFRQFPGVMLPPDKINNNNPDIAYFVPTGGNLGDRMHFSGLNYLLEQTFPSDKYNIFHIFAEVRLTDNFIKFVENRFKAIVVCGTPWFWVGLHQSFRYGEFCKLLHVSKKAYKVAFGLGAAIPLDYDLSKKLPVADLDLMDKVWSQFNAVYTRDKLSVELLSLAKIKATHLPCSALFAIDKYNVKPKDPTKDVIVFYDVSKAHLSSTLKSSYIRNYLAAEAWYIKTYSPSVYTVADFDVVGYARVMQTYRVDNPPALTHWKSRDPYKTADHEKKLLEDLSDARVVVTGRVHAGVPARSMDKQVFILPCDTRAKCVEDVGGKIVTNTNELKAALLENAPQPHINRAPIKKKYLDAMEQARLCVVR